MTKSNLTLEQRLEHAKAQLESGMSQAEYAEKVGVPPSSIGYWVKRYHDLNGGGKPRRKKAESPTITATASKAVVKDELSDMRAEITSLMFVRDELMAKLGDARTKIQALQNVVVVLGHQVGDE